MPLSLERRPHRPHGPQQDDPAPPGRRERPRQAHPPPAGERGQHRAGRRIRKKSTRAGHTQEPGNGIFAREKVFSSFAVLLRGKKFAHYCFFGGSIDTWKTEVVSTWKAKILPSMEKYIYLLYVEFYILTQRGKIHSLHNVENSFIVPLFYP